MNKTYEALSKKFISGKTLTTDEYRQWKELAQKQIDAPISSCKKKATSHRIMVRPKRA